ELGASLIWVQMLGWIFIRVTCRALPTCCENKPLAARGDNLDGRLRWLEDAPQISGEQASGETSQVWVVRDGGGVSRQFSSQQRAKILGFNPALWLAMRWRPPVTRAFLVGGTGLLIVIVVFLTGHLEVFVQ